jgi:hypothetical protein
VLYLKLEPINSNGTVELNPNMMRQGLYHVKCEDTVSRTYSNGLSFKHLPKKGRREYQVAVSKRVRELGLESAIKCHEHAETSISLFSDWKTILDLFDADNLTCMESLIEEMEYMADNLGIDHSELEPKELFMKLKKKIRYHDPKFLAARLAGLCKDRSNLGQSSFLRLVGAGRGYIKSLEKFDFLPAIFAEEPVEFLSFLLLGRAPWTESRLSRYFGISFRYARNFLVGVHNKFKVYIQKMDIVLPEIPALSVPEIKLAILELNDEVSKILAEMTENGRDNTRINRFLKTLARFERKPHLITQIFEKEDFKLTWKCLKTYAHTTHGVLFSALRAVILRACSHREEWKHAIDRCSRCFNPENTLSKPFHERVSMRPIPIDLIMGSKYVIYRPGNAKKMQEIIASERGIWFEIPKVRIRNKRQKVEVRWIATKRVIHALEQGAKIKLFRFNMPRAPRMKIKVDLVLTGPEKIFIGRKHLNVDNKKIQELCKEQGSLLNHKKALGFDINRLSEYLYVTVGDLGLKDVLRDDLRKWHDLEGIIANLQRKLERTIYWEYKQKLTTEIRLHHERRANKEKAVIQKAKEYLGLVINILGLEYVGIEAGLARDTRNTRGGLAKAISSMPDNIDFVGKELLALNLAFQKDIKLGLVNKNNSSRLHFQCRGIIERNGDTGTCKKCGAKIQMHNNSAKNITERLEKMIDSLFIKVFNMIQWWCTSTIHRPMTQRSG